MTFFSEEMLECYKSNISKNIKYLLDIHSINMLELSTFVNTSYSSIYDLAAGKSNPTLSTLIRVSSYFKVSLSQLIGDLPILNNKNYFIKMVPIINWENALNFVNQNTENDSSCDLELITAQIELKKGAFALYATNKTEPQFKSGGLLIFDQITQFVENYENKFVLVANLKNILSVNKLIIENNKIFLQPLNLSIPAFKLTNHMRLLAYLVQFKTDL